MLAVASAVGNWGVEAGTAAGVEAFFLVTLVTRLTFFGGDLRVARLVAVRCLRSGSGRVICRFNQTANPSSRRRAFLAAFFAVLRASLKARLAALNAALANCARRLLRSARRPACFAAIVSLSFCNACEAVDLAFEVFMVEI